MDYEFLEKSARVAILIEPSVKVIGLLKSVKIIDFEKQS